MNISFISRGAVVVGGVIFLFLTPKSQAVNNAKVHLEANVRPGSCEVSFDKRNIVLPSVSTSNITAQSAGAELTGSNEGLNNLSVTCTGPNPGTKAKLTLKSEDGVSFNGVNSWFRNVTRSSENTALAVRVRFMRVGETDVWSDYLSPDDSENASTTVINMDKQSIPFQFSMWCAPVIGTQTYQNCGLPGGGSVTASMSVSVDYP